MLRYSLFALAFVAGSALAQNVATVNNKPIPKTREDQFVKQLTQQGQQDSPELRKRVRDSLVEREILMQEAGKRAIADKPEVKFQIDLQRQNVILQALMFDELKRNPITDETVQAEYDKQKTAAPSKEYRASHILMEKEDEARSAIDQIKKGAKFEELAKKSKDTGSAAKGGDLDWAAPEAYVKPFAEALTKLKKGEMTEAPIQSQFGWHVIRLDDVRDTQFPPQAQVTPQIRESLQQQRVQAFVEDLKKKAKVDTSLK